jgi:antitoxin component YwqK of YwqJK toxin-antitoxin module
MKYYIPLFIILLSNTCSTLSKNYLITYYSDGYKKSEGPVDSNTKIKRGIWKFYYPNGRLLRTTTYLNDKKNGVSIQYFKDGTISDSVNYKDNNFCGRVKFYYPNGQLNFAAYYDDKFLQQGEFTLFYANGKISQKGLHKNGLMVGKWYKYYENGKIESVSFYDKLGNKDSIWMYYNQNGILEKREYYKSDSLISSDKN